MADNATALTVVQQAAPKARFVKHVPRRSLFGETTDMLSVWENRSVFADVVRLVQDQRVSRTELRLIQLDDEVQQCIETRVDSITDVDYRLEDNGASEEITKFLSAQLEIFYPDLVSNAFNARLYGYDVMERIYDYDEDNNIVVKELLAKPFEWFRPDYRRDLYFTPRGFSGMQGLLVDTEYKFLLTLNKPTYKNPRGQALLAWAWWPWFYRSVTWQFWMQFLEKAGSPLLVGTGNDPEAIADALALAYQDAVIGVPTGSTVEAVSSNNKGEGFNVAEDKLVRRIQKLLLGQTLTSDSGANGNGSRAQATVHNEVRKEKTISDIKLIRPTVQNFLDALCKINFPGSPIPKLIYDIDRGLEIERAGRDAILLNSGGIKFTPIYYTRNYGFKEDEFEIPEEVKPNDMNGDKNKNPNNDPNKKTKENDNKGNNDE